MKPPHATHPSKPSKPLVSNIPLAVQYKRKSG